MRSLIVMSSRKYFLQSEPEYPNDERIIEYFKDVSKGVKKNKKDSLVRFDIDVQLSERINEKELIDLIQLKLGISSLN
ncbi:MAG: hypothetical protein IPI93_11930 [Sphingobacteriaceae bacterium]|nr:hypothetical protein [Sphingobacteriaceae bacterium]